MSLFRRYLNELSQANLLLFFLLKRLRWLEIILQPMPGGCYLTFWVWAIPAINTVSDWLNFLFITTRLPLRWLTSWCISRFFTCSFILLSFSLGRLGLLFGRNRNVATQCSFLCWLWNMVVCFRRDNWAALVGLDYMFGGRNNAQAINWDLFWPHWGLSLRFYDSFAFSRSQGLIQSFRRVLQDWLAETWQLACILHSSDLCHQLRFFLHRFTTFDLTLFRGKVGYRCVALTCWEQS